jgi:hypothetical protein
VQTKTNNIFIWENRDNPTLEAPLPVGHIKKRKKKSRHKHNFNEKRLDLTLRPLVKSVDIIHRFDEYSFFTRKYY